MADQTRRSRPGTGGSDNITHGLDGHPQGTSSPVSDAELRAAARAHLARIEARARLEAEWDKLLRGVLV